MNTFFQIITWVFMPLSMPLIALGIVFFTPTYLDFNVLSNALYFLDDNVKKFFFNSFALFGWIFPVLSILVLKFTKQIDNVDLNVQHQRTTPFILSSVFGLMLLMLLYRLNLQFSISKHLFSLVVAGILMTLSFVLINYRFKISVHAGGVGLLLGFLFSYFSEQKLIEAWPLYLACIIGGLVISSRIWLRKHTNKELILGFSLAFVITFVIDFICIKYL